MPSRWDELSRRDILGLVGLFPFMDTPQFHVRAFHVLMNARKWFGAKKHWRAQEAETIYNVLTMGGSGYLLEFLLTSPVMERALWRNYFHHGRIWRGPDHQLVDLTFGEFRYAEDCLNAYLQDKQESTLNTFIGVLWRPGWRKSPFSFSRVDRIAAKAAKLPERIKLALLLQYIAMRGFLMAQNKDAFDPPSEENTGTGATWGTLISMLAANITDVERIENMGVWAALEWIANRKKIKPKTTTDEQ